jgi:hypothetical protein
MALVDALVGFAVERVVASQSGSETLGRLAGGAAAVAVDRLAKLILSAIDEDPRAAKITKSEKRTAARRAANRHVVARVSSSTTCASCDRTIVEQADNRCYMCGGEIRRTKEEADDPPRARPPKAGTVVTCRHCERSVKFSPDGVCYMCGKQA